MPVSKGKGCMGDVMDEFKKGQLHSGKKGPVVKSKKQAIAIGLSMCNSEDERKKKKGEAMAIGYSEQAAEIIAELAFKQKKDEEGLEEACWPGYEAIGMKPGKGGKSVPNCVPKGKKKKN